MRSARRLLLLFFTVACLMSLNLSEAKKPDNVGNGGGNGGNETPPRYEIIELGDYTSTPTGISPASDDDDLVWVAGSGNEAGYTAGMYSVLSQSDAQVMTGYLPEPRTSLDGGPGSAIYGATFNRASNAYAVNAGGDIVGGCDFYDPDAELREFSEHRAALWLNTDSGYQLIDLGTEDPTHNYSSASDLNDLGIVVGTSGFVDFGNEGLESFYRAVVWDPVYGVIDLNDLLPADSDWVLEWGAAVNNVGQVCGRGVLNGNLRGFVFDLNTHSVEAVPLPEDGLLNSAVDINDAGHVTGWFESQSLSGHAYLWTGGEPVDLGSLTGESSSAVSINANDEIVGSSSSTDEGAYSYETLYFATYWNYFTGAMLSLEEEIPSKPQWEYLKHAGDINDQGWIVSHGRKAFRGSVTWHGIILVPAN